MASGVSTPNIDPANLLDEVIGNRDGSTVRIPVSRLAQQLSVDVIAVDKQTRADLYADLSWPSDTRGAVWGDPVEALRGVYVKSGPEGEGTWTRIGDLPQSSLTSAQLAAKADKSAVALDISAEAATRANADAAEVVARQAAVNAEALARATTLAAMQTQIDGLAAGQTLRGTWPATGAFPPAGNETPAITTVARGDSWSVSLAGTVGGEAFAVGDTLIALVNNPSTSAFAGQWARVPNPQAGLEAVLQPQISHLAATQYGQLSRLLGFARERVCRVLLSGTSIANNSNSAIKGFFEALKGQLADSGNITTRFGEYGGSYSNTVNGWRKQPYGGFSLLRMRGDSTATPLVRSGTMRRYVLRYSTETDGGEIGILVDGVAAGTINCQGAQSVGREFVLTWPNLAYRTITIQQPASGYAYIENDDICQDMPGIHTMDGTLGGGALQHHVVLRSAQTGQVAGHPIDGWAGIDGFFGNLAANTVPDLTVCTYTVNDAGGTTFAQYKAALDRLVAQTRANGSHLLLIVEMGGHYSMSGSPNHARFEQIRAYINAQAVHDHVTVVDWHGASGLADGDAAVERLMPIYYNITSVNAAAGTFLPAGGDAIHTNNLGYAILYSLLCQITGVSPDGRSGRTASAIRMLGLRRTPLVHPAVPPNAPALVGMAGLARDLPLITGEVARGIVGGVSRNPYSDRDAPLWFCPDVINYAAVANDYILAGGLSDEFGPYRQISGGSPYGQGFPVPGVGTTPVPMTLTVIVGPGGGSVRFSNASATAYLPLDIDGVTMTPTLTTQLPNDTDKPMAYHLTTSGVLANSYLVLSGNLRGVYLTPTTWPCIAGKEFAKARQHAPMLRLGEDIDASKVIDGQVYRTVANGKRLTQRAIGKVWRPLENRWSGLYTLLNRADAEVLEMVPNGTLTANAFDERLGGITRTTSANPSFAEAKVAADLSARAFAAADAGKRWTISGQHLAAGLRIQLYTGSINVYLGLALDGTWVNHGGAHNLAPNLLSGAYSDWRNRGIAISFDLPDAGMLDGRNWGLRLYQNGGGAGTLSEWTAAEGGMALV